MQNTVFGKIVRGEIPVSFVYEDEVCVAFADAAPVAPTHLLVIPRTPYEDICEADEKTVGHVMRVAAELGAKHCPNGFRLVTNRGEGGGQSVYHWHVHVLGGRDLTWPPG